jgi:hypothetical protein
MGTSWNHVWRWLKTFRAVIASRHMRRNEYCCQRRVVLSRTSNVIEGWCTLQRAIVFPVSTSGQSARAIKFVSGRSPDGIPYCHQLMNVIMSATNSMGNARVYQAIATKCSKLESNAEPPKCRCWLASLSALFYSNDSSNSWHKSICFHRFLMLSR